MTAAQGIRMKRPAHPDTACRRLRASADSDIVVRLTA